VIDETEPRGLHDIVDTPIGLAHTYVLYNL